MEVNSLVLKVASQSVEKATKRLTGFTGAATAATSANAGLATSQTAATGTSTRLAGAATVGATATSRQAAASTANATATAGMATAQTGATATTRTLTGATATLGATMTKMLAPLLALLAPLLAVKKLFSSTVELQDYQAQLKTATGSVENAGIAFEALEDFASSTPFALEQSLEAFTKLTNLGLTPSERALTSYGNTASAMGKDLTQLIEAVADATTGEFERLKEFGIKAKSEGDNVTFTFRGVATTIGKNSAEIEEYLTRLGENEFAGAMADRMDTLGGKVSNLGDLWNQLFRTISEQGAGELLGSGIQFAIDTLSELIAMLESGQFEKSIESWTVAFEGWADDFDETISFIGDLAESIFGDMGVEGAEVWEIFIDALKLVPATVRYWVQRIVTEIVVIGQYGAIAGKAVFDGLKFYFEASVNAAIETAKAIGNALASPIDTFMNGGIDFSGVGDAYVEGAKKITGAIETAEAKAGAVRQARIDSLESIKAEYEGTAQKVVNLRKESEQLRAAYDAEKIAKEKARGLKDRLADFKVKPTGGGARSGGRKSGGASSRGSSGPSDFEKLVEDLRKEESAIEESYLKRLELVRKNTAAGSAIRAELEGKLGEQYEESVEKFREKQIKEVDVLKDGHELQLEELNAFYERRRQVILENTALTEEEKKELELRLNKERLDTIAALEKEKRKQQLDLADEFFGGIAQLSNSNNKKLARIGKAAAIAQTTIKTYESATSAYAAMAGIPYVGPALGAAAAAAAVAAGLANISAIRSSGNGGNFMAGGILGGPSATGDAVQFNGNRGEAIINFEQQRRLLNIANGGAAAGGGSGNITIINQTSVPFGEVEQSTNAAGERQLVIREAVKQAKAEIAREGDSGVGPVVSSFQRNGLLRRRGQA